MKRYWIRIALGALLIFGCGLVGLAAVRKGKAEVRNFLAPTARRLPLSFANIGFRLDGRHIGELTGLDIARNGPADIGKVTGHVELSSTDGLDALGNCSLTLENTRHLNTHSSFSCAAAADLENGNLVKVGEFIFQPGKLVRPFYLPSDVVADWRRSEVQQLEASLARDGHGGVRANGSFGVLDREHGPQTGTFELRADSQGAVFSVRDADNQPLVDFSATHGGLNLNVRDRHGRNLLRLLADSIGAALNIHAK
jgi:hypothetical protein